MFRVGQKVVCINANPGLFGLSARWDYAVTKGEIYTVRWVGVAEVINIKYDGVRLVGIVRDCIEDTPFHGSRFRPLVETKTDISIFTKMLKGETINA